MNESIVRQSASQDCRSNANQPSGPEKGPKSLQVAASGTRITERYLEELSAALVNAWDLSRGSDSIDLIRKHTAPDFANKGKTLHENPAAYSGDLEDFIAKMKTLKRLNPDWRVNAFNFTAILERGQQTAVIWFTSGASGNPGGSHEWTTNRECVLHLHWRRRERDQEWECYSHGSIRGGGGGSDMF